MFQNQVIIVTGAGNGIGRATALAFSEHGAKVVVNDINEAAIMETTALIERQGGEVLPVVADISQIAKAKELVEKAVVAFGSVDVLVNNAGIIRPAMIHKMEESQWDQVVDVSLKGTFNCIQAVSTIFMTRAADNPDAHSNGKIVNITSTAALGGTIGQINYSAAKAGVIGVTMSVAKEWGKYSIQSNAVAFGVVETDMTATVRSEKFADMYKSKIPLGRFATVDSVVPSILFLASEHANYITGHVLNVSGGVHIGY